MDFLTRLAHRLAHQCRYAGDTHRFYSVAEHSVHMYREAAARGCPRVIRLAMLLHDAPEYVTGDLVPLVKKHRGIAPWVNVLESDAWADIARTLGLPLNVVQAARMRWIKNYDDAILAAEAATVAMPQPGWAPFEPDNPLHVAFRARIEAATAQHDNHDLTHWRDEIVSAFHAEMQAGEIAA